jgi:hypothetical protein
VESDLKGVAYGLEKEKQLEPEKFGHACLQVCCWQMRVSVEGISSAGWFRLAAN